MTPKERFRASGAAKRFLEIVDDPVFQIALDAAFLQHTAHLQPCNDMQTAAANGYRTEGARAFVAILSNLPIEQEPPKPTTSPNLKHRV